jgi:hypothetical protein
MTRNKMLYNKMSGKFTSWDRLKRREFLKKATIGTAGLATLPALGSIPTASAQADAQMNFHFVCISYAGTVANVLHGIMMTGDGQIQPNFEGGGFYSHNDASSPAPKTILSSGTWAATRLVSWKPIGNYGVLVAGVLEMEVNLLQQIPSAAVIAAKLKVVCDIPAAKLINPNENGEGFELTIPDADFGPFKQVHPALGLTLFSAGRRVEDKILDDTRQQLQTTSGLYLPTAALIPSVIAGGLAFAWVRSRRKK